MREFLLQNMQQLSTAGGILPPIQCPLLHVGYNNYVNRKEMI